MKYVKPEIRKITADELKEIIVANANSACGFIGCPIPFAGNQLCMSTYHSSCSADSGWHDCPSGSSFLAK